MLSRALSSIGLVVLLTAASGASAADRPGAFTAAPGYQVRARRSLDLRTPPPQARAAWARLVGEVGAAQAIWDRDTGVPTRVWGPGVAAPGAQSSTLSARSAAQDFLAAHLDLLAPGSRWDDFKLASDHTSAGIRSVGYFQYHRGRRVVGGQMSVRFKNDRLALVASEALPRIQVELTDTPVTPTAAEASARAWLVDQAPNASAKASAEPVILPLVRGAKLAYREVLEVEVRSQNPLGLWTVFVDAATGEPVARVSRLREATGLVQFKVPERSPSYGDRIVRPAPLLKVALDGVAAQTDAAGVVDGLEQKLVQIDLGVSGQLVKVNNTGDPAAKVTLPLEADMQVTWDSADVPEVDAQLTAYISANVAKEYVRKIDPTLAWLDDQVSVTVNIEVGTCNAMSDGNDLYFYAPEDGICENTARITDVVYHETGHSVHGQSLIPGVGLFEGALSEGISDYLAATIVGDPKMARGFFLTDEPLRDLDPDGFEWHWPEDTGEAHDEGRIIGGTLWDLRVALAAEMGDAEGIAWTDHIYYEATRRASDIPTMYPESLLVDDDDGDLANGTPHGCIIDTVFYAHGLVGAAILGGRVRTLAAEGDGSLPVELEIHDAQGSCIDLAPTGATLEWRARGSKEAAKLAMTPIADGYAAKIPPQPDGTVIEYRVIADISDGTQASYPENPGLPWYERYYGPVTPIYCTSFETDPVAEGWELFNEWEQGAPAGKSGDADKAFDGSSVLGTDLGADGDGLYDPMRVSTLRSPTIDIPQGFDEIRLQYQRWLNVEDSFFDQATISVGNATVWTNFDSMQGDQSSTHHRDHEWCFHDIDITSKVKDGSAKLTFQIASDGGLELGGWNIDALCVVGVTQSAASTCGDGELDEGEECDDGNTDPGDGCSPLCTAEDSPTTSDSSGGSSGDESGSDGSAETGNPSNEQAGCGCRGAKEHTGSSLLLLTFAALRRRRARC